MAVSNTMALTEAGCSLPKASVPNSASMALANRFCGFQPMVLNAKVTPTALPSDSRLALLSARMVAMLSAWTERLPSTVKSL